MHTSKLRRVGGSIMLALPPVLLDLLELGVGAKVGINVEKGRLIIEPKRRPSYTLDELLAQCEETTATTPEDLEWINSKPVGKELL